MAGYIDEALSENSDLHFRDENEFWNSCKILSLICFISTYLIYGQLAKFAAIEFFDSH